jgi:ABC-type transporter Mla subunit MlaD
MGFLDSITKKNPFGDLIDDVNHVIRFVKDHGDDLIKMMREIPEVLGHLGAGLSAAGGAAGTAAHFLVGHDSPVDGLVDSAAKALDSCRDELASAVNLVHKLAEIVGNVHEGAALQLTSHA